MVIILIHGPRIDFAPTLGAHVPVRSPRVIDACQPRLCLPASGTQSILYHLNGGFLVHSGALD